MPLLAGWALTVLTGLGPQTDSTTVAGGMTIAVAAVCCLAFRVVERLVEKASGPAWLLSLAGLLLGYAKPPRYESTDDVAALVRASRS
ncbi:hypothetical protein BN159_5999 [Streptomyces davaonensis JCM 4913]|uniref:Uncharacterized protein n=1 Tax=Streptomyces davaonensis (strain DSM 101723 / JCM 4913 / KCC S-0913 / 768) TaxID=1214101 RepID=K4RAI0_STRDJ|nr:hypothetical protein [Streptomyces davaonensis]CCK30378.1 hypothetical protein BN159_5999 [Streptomyces davaonensis JCM 4913]